MQNLLFVGTLNQPTTYFESANGDGLSVHLFDDENLASRRLATARQIVNPTFLTPAADGRTVYAIPRLRAGMRVSSRRSLSTASASNCAISTCSRPAAQRLQAGWQAAQRARKYGPARSHVERLLEPLPAHCKIISVIDGHPATLSWLGGVAGHRTHSLGVEHFGQTGTVDDLYRHYGIDAFSIAQTAIGVTAGKPFTSFRSG